MDQKSGKSSVLTRTGVAGGAKVAPLRPVNTRPPQATAKVEIMRERIAQRAYDIWVKQGCCHGHDQGHWLEAERQLRVEMGIK